MTKYPYVIDPQYLEDDGVEGAEDALSAFYLHASTNTPYTGYVGGYHSDYGFMFPCTYMETKIVLVESDAQYTDYMSLDEKLSAANTLTGIMSFVSTAAGTMQANELFYIDDMGQVVKNSSSSIETLGRKKAAEIGKIGKNFGKAISYVNIGITATQLAREGWNINTGTDTVVCAIGFIPGVGWVISGIYTIANIVSYATTGRSYAENKRNKLYDIHYKFNLDLKNWVRGWFSCGGYNFYPGF